MFKLLDPNPPIRAKIRTGIQETVKGKSRPKATDHFVSDDPMFMERFPHTTELVITFPFRDPEECLRTSFEFWKGNGILKCWSNDGEIRNTRNEQGDWEKGRCKGEQCHYYTGKSQGCSVVGRLRFKIPIMDNVSLWQLDTRSWNTMNGLAGALQVMGQIHPDQPFLLSLKDGKTPKGRFKYVTLTPLPFTPPAETPAEQDTPEEPPEEEPDVE